MNKHQEALNTLVKYANENEKVGWVLIYEENILQELVDKETSMKPIDGKWCKCGKPTALNPSFGDYGVYLTPRCECGQVIDWSDEE